VNIKVGAELNANGKDVQIYINDKKMEVDIDSHNPDGTSKIQKKMEPL
jgi:hypothetical protein